MYDYVAQLPAPLPFDQMNDALRDTSSPIGAVADIGGGTGLLARNLTVGNPTIVDESAEMAEKSEFDAIVTDASDIPVGDDHFDAAVSGRAFHHIPEGSGVLPEIRRVVRDGGDFLVLDFNPETVLGSVWERMEQFVTDGVWFRTADEMAAEMERAGFASEVLYTGNYWIVRGRVEDASGQVE